MTSDSCDTHGAEVKHRGTLRTLLVQASAECPACPSLALRAAPAAAAHRPHHHGAEVKHRGTLRTLLALPLRCEPRLLPRRTALTTTVLRSITVAHCARCLCRCKEAGHARSPPALLDFLHPPALCPLCVVRCPSLCVGHTTRVGILTTLASNYSLSEVPLDRRPGRPGPSERYGFRFPVTALRLP